MGGGMHVCNQGGEAGLFLKHFPRMKCKFLGENGRKPPPPSSKALHYSRFLCHSYQMILVCFIFTRKRSISTIAAKMFSWYKTSWCPHLKSTIQLKSKRISTVFASSRLYFLLFRIFRALQVIYCQYFVRNNQSTNGICILLQKRDIVFWQIKKTICWATAVDFKL